MTGNVSQGLEERAACRCGCGRPIPARPPGLRGRRRVFATAGCAQMYHRAATMGWTPASPYAPRAFVVLVRKKAIPARPCACGCGAEAKWARASCAGGSGE